MVGFKMDGQARDRVMKLMDEKERIEREIRDHTAVLETNNIGMHDLLVDSEGFPRNDIDVYKVRHARHRIICLQNDHKTLMKGIEQGLAEVHSAFVGPNGEGPSAVVPLAVPFTNGHFSTTETPTNNGDTLALNDPAFASIGHVQSGSPADLDGLCEGDEVLAFGSISSRSFTDITQVHQLVSHSTNQPIRIQIRREQRVITLNVTPRLWTQPGLLGCHIRRL